MSNLVEGVEMEDGKLGEKKGCELEVCNAGLTEILMPYMPAFARDCLWKGEMWSGEREQAIIIHWASKETYYFFRVTFTEIHCIKMIHN